MVFPVSCANETNETGIPTLPSHGRDFASTTRLKAALSLSARLSVKNVLIQMKLYQHVLLIQTEATHQPARQFGKEIPNKTHPD